MSGGEEAQGSRGSRSSRQGDVGRERSIPTEKGEEEREGFEQELVYSRNVRSLILY